MAEKTLPDEVLAAYCREPEKASVQSLGSGNINDTYLVQTGSRAFVLQRINGEVFPEPLTVIDNFTRVTSHLVKRAEFTGRKLQVATQVTTMKRDNFYLDKRGSYWRGQRYLPHKSYSSLAGVRQAYQVGRVLAIFHLLVADLDLQDFADPLPGFHDLPLYLEEYDRVTLKHGITGGDEVRFCLSVLCRFRPQATDLQDPGRSKILPRRLTHGDPKVDNFIFDDRGQAVGLLDLDTVRVGLLHHDLGDCLRSCCNRQGEKGGKGAVLSFDLDFCRALLDGYFSIPEMRMTEDGLAHVYDAVLLICYELGLRFFTDHLRGNRYFKVRREGDNLRRAVNQFRLTEDVARKIKEIQAAAFAAVKK